MSCGVSVFFSLGRLMLAEGQKKAAEEKLREAEQERVGET